MAEGNLRAAIPIVRVTRSAEAEAFYTGGLGFTVFFSYRPGAEPDPCFMGVRRDGATLHVSSFPGDGVTGSAVNVMCRDVDALFAEFQARGTVIALPPTDQSWGDRELYVRDPDGNTIRFQQSLQPGA